MKAVIIIPTYNERENIVRLLPRLEKFSPRLKGWKVEILVVDDNSPDGTAEAVRKTARKNKEIHLLLKKEKEGLGAAYSAGMKEAFFKMRAHVCLVMDADLSHDPRYIPQFLKEVENGADFVVGSRYIKGGSIAEGWAPHRKFLSIFGNKIVSLILGRNDLSDWTSGYRVIKKEVFKKVAPKLSEARGYTFNVSFAYHTLVSGFKTREVPIRFIDRTEGQSKLGLEYLFHTPIFLFKTRLKRTLGVH